MSVSRYMLAHRIADIEIVGKIKVHPEFLNPVQRVGRVRVLGDWIAADRMRQVGDKCAEVHGVYASPSLPSHDSTASCHSLLSWSYLFESFGSR